ncbi:helix-turn-helix domain-containing protein [Thomasclavelia cocleata]|uniref:helix-turn-helix domain-containing protein n=1 Tax=Thomasclavelia cocleata TaxID=69824 RepID=UPI000E8DB199|nr:helix-turn-helix transcriptional regulator [Thomasclavelia cocleata]HBV41717.1 XRE family transcriptional regulator [Desulfovibrio sp.]
MPIKSNLISIMEKKSIGYEELQYLSNTSPDTVARARDDRISTCQLKTLEKLANALDVSVHDLFEHKRYPL